MTQEIREELIHAMMGKRQGKEMGKKSSEKSIEINTHRDISMTLKSFTNHMLVRRQQ